MIDEKRALADAVVGTGEAWLTELSTDALAELVVLAAMSRPRKPYGPHVPGRLYATMIKVLAAEISDQGRLSRGKRYWADDAVVDIVVGHGAVTAEMQGGRPAALRGHARGVGGHRGAGQARPLGAVHVPRRRGHGRRCLQARRRGAVRAQRRGGDRPRTDRPLARREPRRTQRRHGDRAPHSSRARPDDRDDGSGDDDDESGGADVIELRPLRRDPALDSIGILLAAPGVIPALPEPSSIEHRGVRDRLLGDVLDDALDHLAIRWE